MSLSIYYTHTHSTSAHTSEREREQLWRSYFLSLGFTAAIGDHCHMPQFAKNNLMLFEEHCVIFYAKFVIDDQVGSRIINVI